MISGVARTLDRRSTLVVITSASDDRVQRARRQGARVVLVDFNTPSTLVSLRLWRHLGSALPDGAGPGDQPVVAGPDQPSTLRGRPQAAVAPHRAHGRPLAGRGVARPAVRRIRHPMGGRRRRQIRGDRGQATRRHHRDGTNKACICLRHFAIDSGAVRGPDPAAPWNATSTPRPVRSPLPALTLVERDAEEYLRDHEFYRQQAGFISEGPAIDAVAGGADDTDHAAS